MIPAAAVLAILYLTPPVLEEFNTNLSTLLPFSRMNEYLDEVKGLKEEKHQVVVPYINPFEIPPSPSVKAHLQPSVTEKSSTASKPEVKQEENTTISVPESTEVVTKVATTTIDNQNYFIIGGCFREKENAENFLAEMKSKGIEAVIIGQNNRGLYMVSLYTSPSFNQASDKLPDIKSNIVESAWVYKK